jgi:peptidoglycan/LPS O-acetylase OafA/YrhL
VISGFLITLLLLREQQRAGAISLPRFYLRRGMRIFPAYFVYLAIIGGFAAFGVIDVSAKSLVAAATYTTNIFWGHDWCLVHTWSLCVEEHFYFIWPLALVLWGRRRAWQLAAVCVLLTPVIRGVLHVAFRDQVQLLYFTFTRMDAIAAGCCLAFCASSPTARSYMALTRWQAGWLGFGSIALLVANERLTQNHSSTMRILGYYSTFAAGTVSAVAVAALVWVCITNPDSIPGKFLNSKPVAYIGTLSYSLYLYQQPFFNRYESGWAHDFPANALLLGAAALGSYYLIERPFLSMKQRFLPG